MPLSFRETNLGARRHVARVAIALLVLASCTRPGGDEARVPAADSLHVSDPAPPAAASNEFDPESLRVGRRMGAFVVEQLDVQRASDGQFVGWALFAGEVEISGVVMRNPDAELPDLCIELDSVSASRLPRWPGAARRSWLCFTNAQGGAVERGAYDGGEPLRAVIDQLRVVRYETDAYNTARLVRVVEPRSESHGGV